MIHLTTIGRAPRATVTEPITTGSVGMPVEVELSSDFDGLACIVCFRTEYASADVPLAGGPVTVPPQCLEVAGATLEVGVYGALEDGTVVIPTAWAVAGTVRKGATPSGVNPVAPTPSWVAQIQAIAMRALDLSAGAKSLVTSLDSTRLVGHGPMVEVVGIPAYVSDVSDYESWGLTETGWYVFARVESRDETKATTATSVVGAAAAKVVVGAAYVDVAVRFEVAAMACPVTVTWDAEHEDSYVFVASDLAVRNLDYRTTFYVYDITPYVTWEFGPATGKFQRKKAYFELVDGEYVQMDPMGITYSEEIPEGVWCHTKVIFEGMVRNVTYRMPEVIDCPLEFRLPDVPSDGYGAWYEIQTRYQASYSMTLVPASEGVKAATDSTQSQTAGLNIIDLHYAEVADAKVWRMINTHSNITNPLVPESLAFRKAPDKVTYAAGEALDMTGAELVATYTDGTRSLIALDAIGLTLSPADGATLAAGTTEVTASFASGDVTVTATTPITVE